MNSAPCEPDLLPLYDVAIVGAGISGAAVFARLAKAGYRVLLIDKGDFASGTSQSSGMLAWGGLLYLKNLEFGTVRALCRDRDTWLESSPDEVNVAPFRYFPLRKGGRSRTFVRAALEAYWLLGGRRRRRSFTDPACPDFLNSSRFKPALAYEEAAMTHSDARITLDWILKSRDDERHARNHTELVAAHRRDGKWPLDLRSPTQTYQAGARVLVNAAGIWAGDVAALAGIDTGHTHVRSKGVYLIIERPPGLEHTCVFEMGENGDVLTLSPWGPVALFGPTETLCTTALAPSQDDVAFLIERAGLNLAAPLRREQIIGLRSGVRPLALKRGAKIPAAPIDLSRSHVVEIDETRTTVTLFGGKFTSAKRMASETCAALATLIEPSGAAVKKHRSRLDAPTGAELPNAEYAVQNEQCKTLDDYLRRRTNIAQWTPRLGLGTDDSNSVEIERLARIIEGPERASSAVLALRARADEQDALIDAAFEPGACRA